MSTSSTRSSSASDDGIYSVIVGLVVVGFFALSFLYRAFIDIIPDPNIRAGVIGLFLVLLLITLAIFFRRYGVVALFTNVVVVCLTCAMPLLFIVLYDSDDRIILIKGGAILILAFLPGGIYLQFITTRGTTLQEEFILNLYRLHIDDYRNLPEPPQTSLFHERWKKSGGAQFASARSNDPKSEAKTPMNLYLQKFQGVYGTTTGTISRENLAPVLFTTLLLSIGWVGVFQPEVMLGLYLPVLVKSAGSATSLAGDCSEKWGFVRLPIYRMPAYTRWWICPRA